jgi:hypothetical protein
VTLGSMLQGAFDIADRFIRFVKGGFHPLDHGAG